MSYFYYHSTQRAVIHKSTGARLPHVPPTLGSVLVRLLSGLRGVDTKAEAECEMTRAVVQVAADAVRKCK
jgi:hypothetical protein